VWAFVPAHLGSRRLPRKALALIDGRPLVAHVVLRARAAAVVSGVVVVTDAEPVARAVEGLCRVILTGPAATGTERCAAALRQLDEHPRVVVNVQGDQPMLDPAHVDAAVAMLDRGFDVGTVAAPLTHAPERAERVKVIIGPDGRAHGFSRQPVPHGGPYWAHVGIYAFRPDGLLRCAAVPPWPAVAGERLEQLPWLGAGLTIGVAKVEAANEPVDAPVDLDRVRSVLASR